MMGERAEAWEGTMARLNVVLDASRTGSEAESLNTGLRERIVGQEEAIREIVSAYQMHLTGMSPHDRPIANFLFLGPTGSGKTRTVEATAECLVGTPKAVVKIDCAEFQHSHEIAKLIGSPPGYLGHRETHPQLSQEAIDQYQTDKVKVSFVLFDEIEKASDSLWKLLLGILDKGTLRLGDNRKVDFSRSIVFMTSNLGAAEMSSLLSPRLGFGFSGNSAKVVAIDNKTGDKVSRSGVDAARKKFTPEFMNRLDRIVVFKPLSEDHLRKILDIELRNVQTRVFEATESARFVLNVTEPARSFLLKEGTDMQYGARHLKRAIERLLVQPITNLMASGQVKDGDRVRVDYDGAVNRAFFVKEDEGIPAEKMAEIAAEGYPQQAAAARTAAIVHVPAAKKANVKGL
jgi:ATP-dependent Clp protease ATP-binding subunit ClpB